MALPAVLDKKRVPTESGCNIRNVQYESKCRRAIKRESDFYDRLQLHVTFFLVFFFLIPKRLGVITIVKQRPVLSTV